MSASASSAAEATSANAKDEDDRYSRSQRNDLIIADGFPALYTFKPPSGKSTGDDEFTATKDDPIPRYPFGSFPSSLIIDPSSRKDFLEDCERAFTARAKESGEAYSAGATFFVPARMKPRCALEGLALDIFKAHTKNLIEGKHYDPDRSGAEWWTLVLESGNKDDDDDGEGKKPAAKKGDGDSDDGSDDDEDDEVGMHFDADYGLEAQLPNYMLHPRIATITYLSDIGVPTLILDKVSPPPTDTSKKSLGGDVSTGWLSHPQFGKHVCFDGRFLHGAPGTFFPAVQPEPEEDMKPAAKKAKLDGEGQANTNSSSGSGKRITFLVNVWVNHCPIDADLLDTEDAEAMKLPFKDVDWRHTIGLVDNPDAALKFNRTQEELAVPGGLQCLKLDLPTGKGEEAAGIDECVICNHEVDLKYGASMEMCHYTSSAAASALGRSAQIRFGPSALSVEVGKEVEDDSDDDE